MLAFYFFPFEPHSEEIVPIEYTKEDLINPSKVEELFDYCQILEAYITRPGWEFLISVHGYEGLYKINQRSGWFPEESLEEFKLALQDEIEQNFWQNEV